MTQEKKVTSHAEPGSGHYEVRVTMSVSQEGKGKEEHVIDFGMVSEDQLKALNELFSMMAKNVEAVRNMSPLYEALSKSKPSYLK